MGPKLLDIDQAAEQLGVPRGWLAKAVTARSVSFTKLGKHVRFAQHHLDAIVAAGEQAPETAPPPLASVRSIA